MPTPRHTFCTYCTGGWTDRQTHTYTYSTHDVHISTNAHTYNTHTCTVHGRTHAYTHMHTYIHTPIPYIHTQKWTKCPQSRFIIHTKCQQYKQTDLIRTADKMECHSSFIILDWFCDPTESTLVKVCLANRIHIHTKTWILIIVETQQLWGTMCVHWGTPRAGLHHVGVNWLKPAKRQ